MKDYFTEGSSGMCLCVCVCVCVCVWEELGASRIRVFLKQTQRHHTSGEKLSSESILKFSQSIEYRLRENHDASMDRFFLPLLVDIPSLLLVRPIFSSTSHLMFSIAMHRDNISLNAAHISCYDQMWCLHMQHSWHPTETSDLVLYVHILSTSMLKKTLLLEEFRNGEDGGSPPFSTNASDCAVGNLHISSQTWLVKWLNSWFKLYCN